LVFSLTQLFPELPDVKVVDIGASPIDGDPPYQPLLRAGKVDLVGFEPDEKQFAALQALDQPRATFLPDAIGDGAEHVLRVCSLPGMTSHLEPDLEVLEHFHGFGEWARVVEERPMPTRRLDEVPEAHGCDYLKIDVQGGELAVLQNAPEVLADCLVVHTEVQFVPFYKDQPLFAELDQLLRNAGFWLHQFTPIHRRVFKPMLINQDIYAGLSQDLWSDAVYVRRFTDFATMDRESLEKIALIGHDAYESIDLASLALLRIDEREGGKRQEQYVAALATALA